jgi:hypothetical protein
VTTATASFPAETIRETAPAVCFSCEPRPRIPTSGYLSESANTEVVVIDHGGDLTVSATGERGPAA